MEVECPRHPRAPTIDSQLLHETASMVGKSWPPSREPLSRRVERPRHTDTIYTVETRGGEREQPRNYARRQNGATTNMRDPRTCGQQKTADCTGLLTLALAQVHERTQQNGRDRRLLTDALAQVPHKTPLGTRER